MAAEIASLGMEIEEATAEMSASRLDSMARQHLRFVWRLLRRVGLTERDADDVTQQVFLIAARRLDDIEPDRERAFLYRTAIYTASKYRRGEQRRREELAADVDAIDDVGPDELLDRRRAREMLDAVVAAMPMDLRVVFVLFEIEGLSTPQIARVLAVPLGTAASRLRRAREDFELRIAKLEARRQTRGTPDE